MFLYDDEGTLTLELVVWTDDTTRATALATQDEVYVKTGSTNKLYLGTVYANGSTGFTDRIDACFTWNMYNRRPYSGYEADGTNSWTDSGNGTWSAINGGNGIWKWEFVCGVDEKQRVSAEVGVYSAQYYVTSIALDSTSAPNRAMATRAYANGSGFRSSMFAAMPGIGYHYVQGVETSATSASATAYGDNGGDAGIQSGMRFRWER